MPMNIDARAAVRFLFAALAVSTALARGAGAQAASRASAARSPVGVWRGTSTCLVRPSSCHDEIVVYRIATTGVTDSLTIDGRKIVRGEEQEMGILGCRFTPPEGPLTCTMPQGTWRFRVRNDSLVGELRLPDDTRFRDVRTVRAP